MNILIGYTGFVGSNLALSGGFDKMYHSQDVKDAYGLKPDYMVYAGVTGTKFLANKNPEQDKEVILSAIKNIKEINAKKLILISTVDVYSQLNCMDEDAVLNLENLHPYGRNRLQLEQWVINNVEDYLIVRLPAIYGTNLKKNFIYDMIYHIPPILDEDTVNHIGEFHNEIYLYYQNAGNGFYRHAALNKHETAALRELLKKYDIESINFTDSRSEYQFFNLKELNNCIHIALNNHIKILNLVTEPLTAANISLFVDGKTFDNKILEHPVKYNLKTKFYKIFHGSNGYVSDKENVLEDLKDFIMTQRGYLK